MAISFCFDRFEKGRPYPNLATLEAELWSEAWQKFSVTWPYSEPFNFVEYLRDHRVPFGYHAYDQCDINTLYPISLSFFDFDIDWYTLLPDIVKSKLAQRKITIWFYYSEGDNPFRIKDHLDQQFANHGVDIDLIQFTSANSAADTLPGFSSFVDDECLYLLRNRSIPIDYHGEMRSKKFTVLVRTHKWWRACTMARLWNMGIHECSYFSYNNQLSIHEAQQDNPIEVDKFPGLRDTTEKFLKQCPFVADDLDHSAHNLYSTTVAQHYSDSYVNIVLETHMDVDQSGGVFLTEKTFKPIKNSQLFVIFGAPGSIAKLRSMGYQTFDRVIDHSYDLVADTTERWNQVCLEIQRLQQADLDSIYKYCQPGIVHNQQLFLSSKADRLNSLIEKINLWIPK